MSHIKVELTTEQATALKLFIENTLNQASEMGGSNALFSALQVIEENTVITHEDLISDCLHDNYYTKTINQNSSITSDVTIDESFEYPDCEFNDF